MTSPTILDYNTLLPQNDTELPWCKFRSKLHLRFKNKILNLIKYIIMQEVRVQISNPTIHFNSISIKNQYLYLSNHKWYRNYVLELL